jgi:hypothetical protein
MVCMIGNKGFRLSNVTIFVDEDRETLCQLLAHLHMPDHLEPRLLMQLKILLSHLQKVHYLMYS